MLTNAKSLGKLAGLVANYGEINGIRLFKNTTIELMLRVDPDFTIYDELLEKLFVKPYGGFGYVDSRYNSFVRGNANYIGWGGFGGSFFAFNTEKNIGVSYVMNSLGDPGYGIDPRALRLYNLVYEIIEYLEAKDDLINLGTGFLADILSGGFNDKNSTIAEDDTSDINETELDNQDSNESKHESEIEMNNKERIENDVKSLDNKDKIDL